MNEREFNSPPRNCVFLVGLPASQWFCSSVLFLRGSGHSSVSRWLSLGRKCPCVRIGGLERHFPLSEFKIFILCLRLFSILAHCGDGRGEVSAFAPCSCNQLGRLESGGVFGVHSSLCSSVVLLELLFFSSFLALHFSDSGPLEWLLVGVVQMI